jgi:hypothetical protein
MVAIGNFILWLPLFIALSLAGWVRVPPVICSALLGLVLFAVLSRRFRREERQMNR